MKKYVHLIIFLATFFISACYKYEVQHEGAYSDANNQVEQAILDEEKNKGIIYVDAGKLYLTNPSFTEKLLVPNLPANIFYASINDAHDKIAYKTLSGDITIVSILGTPIAVIPNTSSSTIFDWHANNNSLFYLSGSVISTYGNSVDLAIKDLNLLFPDNSTNRKIFGFGVRKNGSVIGWVEYTSDRATSVSYIIKRNKKDDNNYISYLNNFSRGDIVWLRLSSNSNAIYFGKFDNGKSTYENRKEIEGSVSSYRNKFSIQSPVGFAECILSETEISTYFSKSNKRYTQSINGLNVTALDW
jgi:hypothetical protein